jgi:hypothetical protein
MTEDVNELRIFFHFGYYIVIIVTFVEILLYVDALFTTLQSSGYLIKRVAYAARRCKRDLAYLHRSAD